MPLLRMPYQQAARWHGGTAEGVEGSSSTLHFQLQRVNQECIASGNKAEALENVQPQLWPVQTVLQHNSDYVLSLISGIG